MFQKSGLKRSHGWTMMLKKIQWLEFFASGRTQPCFQRDVRRKPFSKQVTQTWKKPLKSLTSTNSLTFHMSVICLENNPMLPLRYLQNNQMHTAHTAMLICYRVQSKMSLKILRFCKKSWVPQGRQQFW